MKNYPGLRAFTTYINHFKLAFWGTAFSFALANIAIAIVPWLIGHLTASLTTHDGRIVFWTAMLILASISHDFLWRTSEILYLKLLTPRTYRFDDEVFRAVVDHPYGYFVNKFTGKVSSYANMLGGKFRELMDSFHYRYINLGVGMPAITILLFTVNVYTGLIFLASITLMFLAGRPLASKMADAERKQADVQSSVDGYTVDSIANFVSVKAFRNEASEARRLFRERDTLIAASKYSFYRGIWFWGGMSFFIRWVIWPSTFILNVWLFTKGEVSLAQLTTFLTTIVIFSEYIWDVVYNIAQVNVRIAKIEESYGYLFGKRNIFAKTPDIGGSPLSAQDYTHTLELRNVSFAYPDKPDNLVIKNINLTIKHGEKVGLVGHSGGGKSTLMNLLLGYYPIVEGQVLLDGKVVDNRALGDLTSYVPQDTAVFHRSIRENIAYGRQDASEAEIVAAAKHAQADDFIRELDEGYDTLVGERGIKLSGGQRQRVAIARAILKDAPLLMLDEATSALDSESEKLIQAALWQLMQNRTAIVIAHRLSTIQKMDRIIVMDKGTIVEEGSHAELLKQNGVYAKLWAHQSGGFIEE